MTNWGVDIYGSEEQAGINSGSGSSALFTIGTSSTNFVMGSWSQAWGSTPFDAHTLGYQYYNSSGGDLILTNIGVGAAGSEKVVIQNIRSGFHGGGGVNGFPILLFPFYIPQGSRVAFQASGASAMDFPKYGLRLFPKGIFGSTACGQIEAGGVNITTNRGVLVDPGATVNTKGSWVEIVAATGFAYKHIMVCISRSTTWSTAASPSSRNFMVDIAVGASGAEKILIPNIPWRLDKWSVGAGPDSIPWPVSIPVGTRISARCQSDASTANSRELDISVHGFG